MDFSRELSALLKRDLITLGRQIEAFPTEEHLWQTVSGISNSAGNLVLHLEGNLREYIARQLGGIAYTRDRPQEFAGTDVPKAELLRRIEELRDLIPSTVESLPSSQFEMPYPEIVLERELTVGGFLMHLYGHLNWHMGQIDSLRRVLGEGLPVKRATL